MLTNLEPHDVLFIDRSIASRRWWKRCSIRQWKTPAGYYDWRRSAARSIKIDLPPFDRIATTRAGSLTSRDRQHRAASEFIRSPICILSAAARPGLEMSDEGALEVARRSRGTPRIANRRCAGCVTCGCATTAPSPPILPPVRWICLTLDAEGFDYMDRKLLLAVIDKFFGGPVGLDNSPPRLAKSGKPLKMYWSPT